MTEYRTEEGDRVKGVKIYGKVKSGVWNIVDQHEDGTLILEDEDGKSMTLTPIPGTETEAEPGLPFKERE